MKMVFTTGEAAEICKVSQQTIIRCFDNGRLKGFRVPGSRFRRIPREALIAFMKEHGIPQDNLGAGKHKVLIISGIGELAKSLHAALARDGDYEIRTVGGGYEAGVATQEFMPDAIVLNAAGHDGDSAGISRVIRAKESLKHIRLLVTGTLPHGDSQELLREGANDYLQDATVEQLVMRLQRMLS
jgi:excisionase family DNA binding protein